ncbi:MAG: anhydro-N-acetylmuramic acid kinase [Colwellia sp. Phe_37]|nr:MAG: anhydro-N-acetylmuramic acid kinase [Colwellia sp. Phe_37]
MKQFYIGVMSGTSLDGVDVVIADFNDTEPVLVSSLFKEYPNSLLLPLKAACQNTAIEFDQFGMLDSLLGSFYAQCIEEALLSADIRANNIIAIGSHGHTVQHSPNSHPPFTLQIGDANRIAENTGITVVADFRRRDIAAGGQGAPLVPAFHQSAFQSQSKSLAIINIGGISNITFLNKNKEDIIGFDCGPGNTLMDQWCQLHFDMPYDTSGQLSRKGTTNELLLQSMLNDPYFSQIHPKTTGPEYFNLNWLKAHVDQHPNNPYDILSSLCELTAQCIAQSIKKLPVTDNALICGGGTKNTFLMEKLQSLLDCPVETTATYGVHPDWVEAMAFAWLAKQTMEGKPSNTPSVTGAKKPVILGAIYLA